MLSKKNIRLIKLLEKWQNEEPTRLEKAALDKIFDDFNKHEEENPCLQCPQKSL